MSPNIKGGHPKVKEVLDEVWRIHQQKNSDYSEAGHRPDGDVFSNFRECEDFDIDVLSGILVRMSDKWSRLKNLHAKNGDNAVPGEGLRDALLDLMGYAAIYLAELDDQQEAERKSPPPFPKNDNWTYITPPCKDSEDLGIEISSSIPSYKDMALDLDEWIRKHSHPRFPEPDYYYSLSKDDNDDDEEPDYIE